MIQSYAGTNLTQPALTVVSSQKLCPAFSGNVVTFHALTALGFCPGLSLLDVLLSIGLVVRLPVRTVTRLTIRVSSLSLDLPTEIVFRQGLLADRTCLH